MIKSGKIQPGMGMPPGGGRREFQPHHHFPPGPARFRPDFGESSQCESVAAGRVSIHHHYHHYHHYHQVTQLTQAFPPPTEPRLPGGPAGRPHSPGFAGRGGPGHPSSNLQTFYAAQRHQQPSRGSNDAEQMQQHKRRLAAQRERELRNYHQEQQYNRSRPPTSV